MVKWWFLLPAKEKEREMFVRFPVISFAKQGYQGKVSKNIKSGCQPAGECL